MNSPYRALAAFRLVLLSSFGCRSRRLKFPWSAVCEPRVGKDFSMVASWSRHSSSLSIPETRQIFKSVDISS